MASLMASFLTACAPEAGQGDRATEHFSGTGTVLRITPSRSFVEIAHGDIPGYMEAMAMHFAVADTSLLRQVAVSDSVAFTLSASATGVVITEIRRIEP